jgi:hypothetical protein
VGKDTLGDTRDHHQFRWAGIDLTPVIQPEMIPSPIKQPFNTLLRAGFDILETTIIEPESRTL